MGRAGRLESSFQSSSGSSRLCCFLGAVRNVPSKKGEGIGGVRRVRSRPGLKGPDGSPVLAMQGALKQRRHLARKKRVPLT